MALRNRMAQTLTDEEIESIAQKILDSLESKEKAVSDSEESGQAPLEEILFSSDRRTAMSIQNLIIASVATRSVFRRFAQLSDEEKKKVVDKVKEKMGLGDSDDSESGDEDDSKLEDQEKSESEIEDESESQFEKDVGNGEDDESEDADEAEKSDEENESPESEDEIEPELEPESDEDKEQKKDEIEDIVNDLVEEVETLKSDGQVAPKDVLGLITNMMEMVNLLVEAKPPTRRRRKSSEKDEILRELEKHADEPNIRGFLVRIRDSQYYRKPPVGRPGDEPTLQEMKQVLSRVRKSGVEREFVIAERVAAGSDMLVGQKVKYSRNFLRSIGEFGEMGHWTGVVKSVGRPMGGLTLAEVAWDTGDTMKVNVKNLVLVSRLHLEPV